MSAAPDGRTASAIGTPLILPYAFEENNRNPVGADGVTGLIGSK